MYNALYIYCTLLTWPRVFSSFRFFFCLQEGALLCWRQLYTFCLLRACGSPDYNQKKENLKSQCPAVYLLYSVTVESTFCFFEHVCRRCWRLPCVVCEVLLVLCEVLLVLFEVLPCVLCEVLLATLVCMYVYVCMYVCMYVCITYIP